MQNEVIELYLDDIIPNRFQPREKFDEESLNELAVSIKEHGVIQPIIVRKIGEKYEIIAGERRYKASALAGLTKIPAIIRNLDDKEASKVALLENLQRKDLTAIEEARTYQKILELDSMTQEELGQTMGKSQASIANKLRLLALTDEVQEALLNDQISERHARSLLMIENPNEQVEMLNRIISGRMTVRELDNEIKNARLKAQTTLPIEETTIKIEEPAKLEETPVKIEEQIKPEEEKPQDGIVLPRIEDILKPSMMFQDERELPLVDQPEKKESNTEQLTPPESSIPIPQPVIIEEEEKPTPIVESLLNNENTEFLESFKLKDAINSVRSIVPSLREKGMKVSVEETDLGGKYQIIINIDKNNAE